MLKTTRRLASFCSYLTKTALLTILLTITTSVEAHHSVAQYDLKQRVSYAGTVSKVEWQNPHVWIWIAVPQSDGANETVGIECAAPSALRRVGFKWDSVKVGDKVTVTAAPPRSGHIGGLLASIKWADGHKWDAPFIDILSKGGPEAANNAAPPQ